MAPESTEAVERLQRLLSPQSIAYVGGHRARLAAEQCRRLEFPGDIWTVGPGSDHTHLASLPQVPDAVFLGVGAQSAVTMVGEARNLGVGGCVVYAAGFAEAGKGELQEALVDAAGSMPMLGPNCHGFVNAMTGAVLWPDLVGGGRVEAGVALITQSGNIAIDMTMQGRGLPIAAALTLGNQATVDVATCIEALVANDQIMAFGLHIETIPNSIKFGRAARMAFEAGKPIVALKSGHSVRGAALTGSHTASLAGSPAAHEALFRRYGVSSVRSVDDLVGALTIIARHGRLGGVRIVAMSCSGGEASLVADLAEKSNVTFPAFSPRNAEALDRLLDGRATIGNPFDYHTFIWGDGRRLEDCFTLAVRDGFDAAMLVIDMPTEQFDTSDWWTTLDAFAGACASTGTPAIVTSTLPENLSRHVAERLADRRIAVVPGIRSALAAIDAAGPVSSPGRDHALDRRDSNTSRLSEVDSKRILAEAGFPVPPGEIVSAGGEIPSVEVEFPVVVKVLDHLHKSDVGGVLVGVSNLQHLREAVRSMVERTGAKRVLVERHIEGAIVELLVGIRHEPHVGWTLTLGAGGVMAELLRDTATSLLPLEPEEIDVMLASIRVSALMDGFRGTQPVERAASVKTIAGLCELAMEESLQIEVNPLLIRESDVWIVDAILEVRR